MVAHDWATWHHTIGTINATCRIPIRPHLPIQNCHITSATSAYGLCHINLYGLHSQRPFFLPVWRSEQIAISLALDVRLRWNELRWVHDDEVYALVHFEAIPRTLIFELKFDPWSRFWSHLPTERILDPQKLMIIFLSFNTLLPKFYQLILLEKSFW